MKIVVDLSLYQDSYSLEKFKLLDIDGVIIRAGAAHSEDDMLPTFVKWCRELGLPFGFYFYYYPGLAVKSQCELFEVLVNEYPDCLSVWVDIEETKYFSSGNVISPDTLNAFYKTVFAYMRDAFPNKIVGNYSGGWVLNTYIPKAYLWINTAPYWSAYYVKPFTWYQNYIRSLGAEWDKEIPTIPVSSLRKIMEKINNYWPPNPLGVTTVNLWQALTWFPYLDQLTYWQKHIDINICSDENFTLLFGEVVAQPPTEEPMPAITNAQTTVNLNVRSIASTVGTIIKTLPTGTRINVTGTVLAGIWWSRIDYPLAGYVSNQYVLHDTITPPPVPPINNVEDVIDALKKVKAYIDSLISELGQ